METNLADLLHTRALKKASAPALICRGKTMSYAELDHSTDLLAGWFLKQGLKAGARVAIQWINEFEAVQLYFGLFKAGLIAVPISTMCTPRETMWVLGHSGASMHFCHPSAAEAIRPHKDELAGVDFYTELPEAGTAASALPAIFENTGAALIYTSGSTGQPKASVHTHQSLLEMARNCTSDILETPGACDMGSVFLMISVMRIGALHTLLGSIVIEQPAILLPNFNPAEALDLIEKHRCAITLVHPVLITLLLEEQAKQSRDVSSIKLFFAGGDSIHVALQDRARALLKLDVMEGLGMTEAGTIIRNRLGTAIRPGSVGVQLKGIEVRLIDPEGNPAAENMPGELLIRGKAVCSGYWNDETATAEAFRNGWFHTGDLLSRDADGYYWFRGRKKEIIIHGAFNVSPQEVEEVICSHPAVLEAGVAGIPDETWGEQIVAAVTLREGCAATETELRDYAKIYLRESKVPWHIVFMAVLPKKPTEKIDRKSLKEKLLKTDFSTPR
jgi:long-chain acyl-CoA synthetase